MPGLALVSVVLWSNAFSSYIVFLILILRLHRSCNVVEFFLRFFLTELFSFLIIQTSHLIDSMSRFLEFIIARGVFHNNINGLWYPANY